MILLYLSLVDSEESRDFFMNLYETHRKMMFHIAYKILRDGQIAENIVHDVFLVIIKKLDLLSPDDPERNKRLIFQIVKFQAFNEANRMKRIVYEEEIEVADGDLLVEDFVVSEAQFKKAVEIIKSMDEIYSSVLMLRADKYSNKEIASLLGISEDTVRQRFHRGKEKFKKLLIEEGIDDE